MNYEELPETIHGEWWEAGNEEVKYFGVLDTNSFILTTSYWGTGTSFFGSSKHHHADIIYGRSSDGTPITLLDNEVHKASSFRSNVLHEETLSNDSIYPTWVILDTFTDGIIKKFEFTTYLSEKYLLDECRIDPMPSVEILNSTEPKVNLPFSDQLVVELRRKIIMEQNFISDVHYEPVWVYDTLEPIPIYDEVFLNLLRLYVGFLSLTLNNRDSIQSLSVFLQDSFIGVEKPYKLYLRKDHPLSRKIDAEKYRRFPVFQHKNYTPNLLSNFATNKALQDSLRNIFVHDTQTTYLEELLVSVCAAIQAFFVKCEPEKVKWMEDKDFDELFDRIIKALKSADFSKDVRKKFRETFKNEVSLRTIFEHLCSSNQGINRGKVSDESIDSIIDNLIKNRNKAAHGDAIDPIDLYDQIKYIRAHFVMHALKHLGATDAHIYPHDIHYLY